MRVKLTGNPRRWEALGHGYRVDVAVVVWESPNVLTVPLTALFRTGKRWSVFVEENGIARTRYIEIGQRNGLTVEVTAGLREGERVVLSPSDQVQDGVLVVDRELGKG